MKKILLATDFSPNSINAIQFAMKLFGSSDVDYVLLNTFLDPASSATTFVSLADYLQKESQEQLEVLVDELHDEFGSDYKISSKSIYGSLYRVVNNLVEEEHYDFLVIGSSGVTAFESFLLGSNTMNVLKEVKLPTLVVPTRFKKKENLKIGLAFDYKGTYAKDTYQPMLFIAEKQNTILTAVHIKQSNEEDNPGIEKSLARTFEGMEHEFVTIEEDDIALGLEKFVKFEGIDLLTMIIRKHSFFERLMKRSVTKEVSLMAIAAVLVLHEGR